MTSFDPVWLLSDLLQCISPCYPQCLSPLAPGKPFYLILELTDSRNRTTTTFLVDVDVEVLLQRKNCTLPADETLLCEFSISEVKYLHTLQHQEAPSYNVQCFSLTVLHCHLIQHTSHVLCQLF